jgi:hypothetical protein
MPFETLAHNIKKLEGNIKERGKIKGKWKKSCKVDEKE